MGVMTPTVTIGLPVYNGDNYLERAIESVLSQTFRDFELLISDNSSTDRTAEICASAATRDARIRHIRHDQNRGATWNFNSVFAEATGEYFCWLAHDDMWAPEYLRRCVDELEAHPDVVLCFSDVLVIDENDQPIEELSMRMRTGSSRVAERFYDVLMVWHDCLPIFGVIRREALAGTPLIGAYSSGDHVLLARLALLGRYRIIEESLFKSRRHPLQSNKRFNVWVNHHAYSEWFAESAGRRLFLPQWELLRDYVVMVARAPLRLRERARCWAATGRWAIRYRRLLWRDLTFALQRLGRKVPPCDQPADRRSAPPAATD
jgi:glycosyltransferase involved in cell wall biosynthesis